MTSEQHVVTIDPPSPHRKTWVATCSFNDFSRSYRNRAEAYLATNKHLSDEMLANELRQGNYEFDDGRD